MSRYRPDPTRVLRLNTTLTHLIRTSQPTSALTLFLTALPTLTPDHYTLSAALSASARLPSSAVGSQLHSYAIRSGLLAFPHVSNPLLSLYSSSLCPDLAWKVLQEIPAPDAYAWTTLVSAFVRAGDVRGALAVFEGMPKWDVAVWNAVVVGCGRGRWGGVGVGLFADMRREGVLQDHYSYAGVLSLCDSLEMLRFGQQVHAMIIRTGFYVIKESVVNALISMYFRCGDVDSACCVFKGAKVLDSVMYNAVIAGLLEYGMDADAWFVFKKMLYDEVSCPTEFTFMSLMSCCLIELGKQVHALFLKIGFGGSTLVGNATVAMYFKGGDWISAGFVGNEIIVKDIISWNSLISGYSQHYCHESAVATYVLMQRNGIKPDEVTISSLLPSSTVAMQIGMIMALAVKTAVITHTEVCNALISAFAKFGDIRNAYYIFTEMVSRNLISWNSILSGFLLNDLPLKSLELFYALVRTELKPNVYSLSIMLTICASISDMEHGKQLHAYSIRSEHHVNVSLQNGLITMYAKCGCLSWSKRVFLKLEKRDVISWNSIIGAYAQHGDGRGAISFFREMQKSSELKPDKVTFTTTLSACNHSHLITECRQILSSMLNDYGIEPGVDHYSCIIDLLGRSGYLDEVESVINTMPHISLDPHIGWALLSACSVNSNIRLGKKVAEILLDSESNDSTVYVLLSNMNAAVGQWEEASQVREQMKRNGLIKKPGYSWIECHNALNS